MKICLKNKEKERQKEEQMGEMKQTKKKERSVFFQLFILMSYYSAFNLDICIVRGQRHTLQRIIGRYKAREARTVTGKTVDTQVPQ